MITTLIKSQCEESWAVHGWNTCRSCRRIFSKQGAKFSLANIPGPHLLIDLDSVPCLKGRTLCDYLFIADNPKENVKWAVPIELASGKGKDPKKAMEQLQAGADLVEKVIDESTSLHFLPVLVGRFRRVRGVRRNVRKLVRFRGKYVPISVIEAGSSFSDELKRRMEQSKIKN